MKLIPQVPLLLLLFNAAVSLPLGAETRFSPAGGDKSLIRVDGTSNVRDWHAETRNVRGELKLGVPGFWSGEGLDPKKLPASPEKGLAFHVDIPAKSLDGDGSRFNNNLHDYIKARQYETIRFEFTSLELEENQQELITTRVTGDLTFAGVTKPLTFPVNWEREGDNLVLRGKAEFKMSEFGISPPRMMMGALRTADKVTVIFTWVLEPETGGAIARSATEPSP